MLMPDLSRYLSNGRGFLLSPPKRKVSERLQNEHGVGLIEVLMALLVLSLGFLVSANMQAQGMRSNQGAYYQSQAHMLLNDMMDRMRNNHAGLSQGFYNGKSTGVFTKPTCFSSGCGASDIATLDLFEWSSNLQSLREETDFVPVLPIADNGSTASGTISEPNADGVYTLSMSWQQLVNGETATKTVSVKFIP